MLNNPSPPVISIAVYPGSLIDVTYLVLYRSIEESWGKNAVPFGKQGHIGIWVGSDYVLTDNGQLLRFARFPPRLTEALVYVL